MEGRRADEEAEAAQYVKAEATAGSESTKPGPKRQQSSGTAKCSVSYKVTKHQKNR